MWYLSQFPFLQDQINLFTYFISKWKFSFQFSWKESHWKNSYGYDLFPVVVNQQKLVDFFGCFLSQKILSGIFHFLFYFILFLIHCIYTFSSLLFHLDPMGIYYSFWLTVLIGFLCVRIMSFSCSLLWILIIVCFISTIHMCQFLFILRS